jgi:uncharacterized protein YdcH (DUF465 family)
MLEIPIESKIYIDNFLKNKDYIYITTITEEYVDMAYNWFLSLKNIGQEKLSLIACSDKKTLLELKKYDSSINSICLNLNLKKNQNFSEWKETEKKIKIIIPFYIGYNFKKSFFHSDVDIFFNKNPYNDIKKFLKEDDYHIILMSDRKFDFFIPERNNIDTKTISIDKKRIDIGNKLEHVLYGEYNAAFSYININDNTFKKLKQCYSLLLDNNFIKKFEKGTEKGSIQTISNQLYENLNLKIKILSCFDYVNGSLWKVPYLKNKIQDTFILLHYNYENYSNVKAIEQKNKKINNMKLNNHWLL